MDGESSLRLQGVVGVRVQCVDGGSVRRGGLCIWAASRFKVVI